MNEIFNAKSLVHKCYKEYMNRHYPQNEVLDYKAYKEKHNLRTYNYTDLENEELFGMLYAAYRNEEDKLCITFQDPAHTLVVGTTQVGKTWGHVMNSVYALSAKKNKPNFMITDPKGEIFENTAEVLRNRGYKIFALNFKDPAHSHMWNPLFELYNKWMELDGLEDTLVYHPDLKKLSDYTIEGDKKTIGINGEFYSFNGKAFDSLESAEKELVHKVCEIETVTSDLINQLVNSIGATSVQNSRDPCWQLGALEILRGLIHLMLEDALDERSGFKKENMNFMNMQKYYSIIRDSVLSGTTQTPLLRTRKLCHKSIEDESIKHMRAYFENAPTTSRSYMGVFENLMQDWFNCKIYSIANDINIDLNTIGGNPFAIFLITRDYEKSDYYIAGLFIDWVYMQMLKKTEATGGKLNREMFFILDEFANIPPINSFDSKISTALSRRIIFQLYIQSYEQLSAKYGAENAGTIRSNCNVEVFLGSQSYKTKSEFAAQCGKKHIKTADASIFPDRSTMIEVPSLSVNDLENLEQGEGYVKRLNKPVSKSRFEMAFRSPELDHNKLSPEELGINSVPFNDKQFVYGYLTHQGSIEMNNEILNKGPDWLENFFDRLKKEN